LFFFVLLFSRIELLIHYTDLLPFYPSTVLGQSYGLGAPRGEALAPVDYLYSSSTNKLNGAPRSQCEDEEGAGDTGEGYGMHASVSVTSSLEQQVRLLKKELKAKDDKLARLTEHALMMGAHMDKLKGEVQSCSDCCCCCCCCC
jgi:hypothetical protein